MTTNKRYQGEVRGIRTRRTPGTSLTGLSAKIRTPSGTVRMTVWPTDAGDSLRAIVYDDTPGIRTLYEGPISTEPQDERSAE